jgi:hypothetical protein
MNEVSDEVQDENYEIALQNKEDFLTLAKRNGIVIGKEVMDFLPQIKFDCGLITKDDFALVSNEEIGIDNDDWIKVFDFIYVAEHFGLKKISYMEALISIVMYKDDVECRQAEIIPAIIPISRRYLVGKWVGEIYFISLFDGCIALPQYARITARRK